MYIEYIETFFNMRHNLSFARKKSYWFLKKMYYICIVSWSVGDSKVKRYLPVDLSCTPTTVNSMGIFIQNERTNKRMEASRRI